MTLAQPITLCVLQRPKMLQHSDSEVQLLVEMLEGQRDSAMVQAASLFKRVKELEQQVKESYAFDKVNDPQSNG